MTSEAKTIEVEEGRLGNSRLPSSKGNDASKALDHTFFSLSGGILKISAQSRVANRFEGLLSQMIGDGSSARYSKDIERNLDYLHTSLQLDMLSMAAESCAPKDAAPSRRDLGIEE